MKHPVFRKIIFQIFIVAAFCFLTGCAATVWEKPDNLDTYMEANFKYMKVNGMAALVVKNDSIVWTGCYGFADKEKGRPVTPDTPFMIASISKTVVVTAVMQLEEKGILSLKDDINEYLPFSVRNPKHPDRSITAEMLLTHTSSIRDYSPMYNGFYTLEGGGESPIPLGEYLQSYLTKDSTYYTKKSYYGHQPGSKKKYSNVASALAGYLVECISGIPFDQYCEDHIFKPLGMHHTGFRIADFEPDVLAIPYDSKNRPLPHYSYPTYPDGALRTSVNDFSRFVRAYLNGGLYEQTRILEEKTIDRILTPNRQGQGLIWYRTENLMGHSGGDPGVTTYMFIDVDQELGVILFLNKELGIFKGIVPYIICMRLIERFSN